jgi:type IV pilus assembly protein PilB
VTLLDDTADSPARGGEPGTTPRRPRLGDVLVAAGVITPAQLEECIAAQSAEPRAGRRRLGAHVVERGLATDRQVAQALSDVLGVPLVDLAATVVSQQAARLIPRALAERFALLALDLTDGVLRVAMADPTDVLALDDVRLYTKVRTVVPVIATEASIRQHLSRVWSLEEDASEVVAAVDSIGDDGADEDEVRSAVDETPVVRLASVILADAVRAQASDVHLEPERTALRVRYRIDGLLRDVMTLPRSVTAALTSRIKIISGLDIAERRRPQDGRTRLQVDGQVVDARVSTLRTMHGEKVVLRLLARPEGVVPLNRIGLSEPQLDDFLRTMVAPQGLVLITGPTGSGKTSTLYSAVSHLRTPDRNLVTLEDPVEMEIAGLNQMQVNEKAGVTFAAGLRAILRQDPDVILVGEVRDAETAELAMRASLTGHLVFTTLHTNDAAAAVTRLVDMGVEPFLIASSLALVVAQRLVRVPCAACAAPYTPSPRTLQLLGLTEADLAGATLVRGRGCDACGETGYRGRAAIFEVLEIDAGMRATLTGRATEAAIRAAARAAGVQPLRADGIAKAMRGETTLEEVLRVTQVDAAQAHRCESCRRSLDADMAWCPWCDVAVERAGCAGCGRATEPDWRVCPWCRTEHHRWGPGSGPAGEQPHRPTVLVVDDDDSVRGFVALSLSEQADVVVAATAEEALRLAATHELDAAVVDLGLPDLSGIELTRLLRSDTRTALLPLLLLTGNDTASVRAEAALAGVTEFLAKPVDSAVLEGRVEALLSGSKLVTSVPE